jgi:hypothetical protein|tara:strand:+ start:103 stop:405 length:303 start_codon:yes stop_codon:yes gene_type:complete
MSWDNLIPIAGMVASVIAAAAVARHQIRVLEMDVNKLETRLDAQDIRLDRLTTASEVLDRRTDTLAGINSPENMEKRARQVESIRTDIMWIKNRLESLKS